MCEIDFVKELISKKNFDKAIIVLNEIIRKNNNSADAFFELGKIFFIKQDFYNAIINFEKSISIKDAFYSNLLLAKSLKYIKNYRKSLKIFFKIKKSSFEITENIDVEIINCFLFLKKYLYAYKYFDKYSVKDLSLQKQLVYNLLNCYKLEIYKDKDLLKEMESFIYKFLNSDECNDKNVIEKQMLELYEKDILFQKEKFYKYILCKNKEKNKNVEELKYYNFILNKLEIKRQDINLFSKPISLVVTLTNACNIKCDFCNIHKFKLWNLPQTKVKEIIELMPYITYINWLGGEVFLYKNFDKLFDMAVRNNVYQEIITNGLLLNETLISKFINSPMKLSISITSANEKKYELSHKGAQFKNLLQNLHIIKKNIDKRNKNFSYWMYVCVMKENISELDDIIELAYKCKFDVVRFQPIDKLNFKFYNKDIVKHFVKKAMLKAEKYNIKINNILPIDFNVYNETFVSEDKIKEKLSELFFDEETIYDKIELEQLHNKMKNLQKECCNQINNVLFMNKNILFCEHPWSTLIINYGGQITFDCSCLFNNMETVNDKSLLEAWNSPNVQMFRNKIIKRQIYDICNYNCIAYNVHKH
jgi:MoaA/NifB/PqqE/SkfB family radical SAM enzyme